MPDVNLIKDTEGLSSGRKKPITPNAPELSNPNSTPTSGFGGFFKSIFNRGSKSVAAPTAPVASSMAFKRSNSGDDHILQEKRTAAPAVIPLPEDEAGYNVNLLSEELVSTVSIKQRGIVLGLVALGAIVVVALAYGGLLYYQKSVASKTSDVESQLTAVKQQATSLAKEQQIAAETVQKLGAINDLINRHKQWTKFFGLLEKYTLKSVTYGATFTGDIGGTLTLTAKTDSYESVAQQYLIFKQLVADQKFISDFSITGATSSSSKDNGTTVTFSVSLTLLSDDFTLTKDEVAASSSTSSSSNGSLSETEQLVNAQKNLVLIDCYIANTQSDISFVPDFARASVQAAASAASTSVCSAFSSTDMATMVAKLKTDKDQDGVNLAWEEAYGTSDGSNNSGKGTDDYTYVKQQYLASQSTQ